MLNRNKENRLAINEVITPWIKSAIKILPEWQKPDSQILLFPFNHSPCHQRFIYTPVSPTACGVLQASLGHYHPLVARKGNYWPLLLTYHLVSPPTLSIHIVPSLFLYLPRNSTSRNQCSDSFTYPSIHFFNFYISSNF